MFYKQFPPVLVVFINWERARLTEFRLLFEEHFIKEFVFITEVQSFKKKTLEYHSHEAGVRETHLQITANIQKYPDS